MGDIGTGNTLDWGVQVVESLALNDLSANLGTNTESGESTLDGDETRQHCMSIREHNKSKRGSPVGLLNGSLDGVDV